MLHHHPATTDSTRLLRPAKTQRRQHAFSGFKLDSGSNTKPVVCGSKGTDIARLLSNAHCSHSRGKPEDWLPQRGLTLEPIDIDLTQNSASESAAALWENNHTRVYIKLIWLKRSSCRASLRILRYPDAFQAMVRNSRSFRRHTAANHTLSTHSLLLSRQGCASLPFNKMGRYL